MCLPVWLALRETEKEGLGVPRGFPRGEAVLLRSSEPHQVSDLRAELLEGVLCECWGVWEGRMAGFWRLGCDSGMHGGGGGDGPAK